MLQASSAYEVLSDELERKAYVAGLRVQRKHAVPEIPRPLRDQPAMMRSCS